MFLSSVNISHPILYRLIVGLGLLVADKLADGEVVLLHHLPLPLEVGELHVRLVVIESFLQTIVNDCPDDKIIDRTIYLETLI